MTRVVIALLVDLDVRRWARHSGGVGVRSHGAARARRSAVLGLLNECFGRHLVNSDDLVEFFACNENEQAQRFRGYLDRPVLEHAACARRTDGGGGGSNDALGASDPVGLTREAGPAVRVVTTGEMTWVSVAGYPPGYARAMLEGDAVKAVPHTYRVRLPAGFMIQAHTHDSDEHVTVLQGTWSFGVGETFDASRLRAVPAGSFVIIPAGTPHFLAIERDTIVQVHGVGSIGFRPVTNRGASDDFDRCDHRFILPSNPNNTLAQTTVMFLLPDGATIPHVSIGWREAHNRSVIVTTYPTSAVPGREQRTRTTPRLRA